MRQNKKKTMSESKKACNRIVVSQFKRTYSSNWVWGGGKKKRRKKDTGEKRSCEKRPVGLDFISVAEQQGTSVTGRGEGGKKRRSPNKARSWARGTKSQQYFYDGFSPGNT